MTDKINLVINGSQVKVLSILLLVFIKRGYNEIKN